MVFSLMLVEGVVEGSSVGRVGGDNVWSAV